MVVNRNLHLGKRIQSFFNERNLTACLIIMKLEERLVFSDCLAHQKLKASFCTLKLISLMLKVFDLADYFRNDRIILFDFRIELVDFFDNH